MNKDVQQQDLYSACLVLAKRIDRLKAKTLTSAAEYMRMRELENSCKELKRDVATASLHRNLDLILASGG